MPLSWNALQIRSRQSGGCLQKPVGKGSLNQPVGSAAVVTCSMEPNLLQMFVMSPSGAVMTDESVCLDAAERQDSGRQPRVRIMACSGTARQKWSYSAQVSFSSFSPALRVSRRQSVADCCLVGTNESCGELASSVIRKAVGSSETSAGTATSTFGS
jgi:hypothetical protein